jgi:hypothetical protein
VDLSKYLGKNKGLQIEIQGITLKIASSKIIRNFFWFEKCKNPTFHG